MKNLTRLLSLTVLLLIVFSLITGCKKKSDDPVVITPSFIITATSVDLVGGGQGLQFFAKCSNDDVKMTKVIITDPIASGSQIYNLNGNYFIKNEIFALQGTDEGYLKQIGTWTFNFTGNRTADGVAFSINGSLSVGK